MNILYRNSTVYLHTLIHFLAAFLPVAAMAFCSKMLLDDYDGKALVAVALAVAQGLIMSGVLSRSDNFFMGLHADVSDWMFYNIQGKKPAVDWGEVYKYDHISKQIVMESLRVAAVHYKKLNESPARIYLANALFYGAPLLAYNLTYSPSTCDYFAVTNMALQMAVYLSVSFLTSMIVHAFTYKEPK